MAKQRIINIKYVVDKKQVEEGRQATEKARKATQDFEKSAKSAGDSGSNAFRSIKDAIISTGIIALVTTLSKKIFDLGTAQEQTNVAITTFVGSAQKAKKIIQELTQFSIVTPFTPDQVFKAAKTLLAFGVDAKNVTSTLKILGDVSAGTGKDLTEMAVIFGQIRSTGRLMGQDLLQLINAGFNPLQVISEKTGKSVGLLKKEMEKGLITFEAVEQAFRDATSEGGMFFNLMEEQSKTIGGRFSTLVGNVEEIFKGIFESNDSLIGGLVDSLNYAANTLNQFIKDANRDILSEAAQQQVDKFVTPLEAAFEKWLKSGKKDAEDLNSEFLVLIQNINQVQKENEEYVNQLGKVKSGTKEFEDLNFEYEVNLRVGRELNKVKNEYLKKISDENSKLPETIALTKEQEKALKSLQDAIRQGNELTAKDTRQTKSGTVDEDQIFLFSDKDLEQVNEGFDRYKDLLKDANQEADEILKDQADKEFDALVEKNERELDEIRRANEEKKRLQQAVNEFILDSTQQLLYALFLNRDTDEADQQARFERELMLAGDNERAKDQIKLRQQQKAEKDRKRQKEQEKKDAITKISIDTAINVIRSIANNGGIPAGLPFGALAAAAGLFQIATVRKFNKGVIDLQGPGTTTSDSIPAMLSRRESVMTAEETVSSKGILKAIRAKKLDDAKINKLYARSGGTMPVFNDRGIISAIEGQPRTDLVKQGDFIYERKRKNRIHTEYVLKKYVN